MDERHGMILLSVVAFFAGVSMMAEVRASFQRASESILSIVIIVGNRCCNWLPAAI
jgi:hypothetical protein